MTRIRDFDCRRRFVTHWIDKSALASLLEPSARRMLSAVPAQNLSKGAVVFQPGDAVRGFAIVLRGRISVVLSGPAGRDIQLYDIEPGQTCVQSTLGILGGVDYSALAVCDTSVEVALIPRDLFQQLLNRAPPFRDFVFSAFANRMQAMMQLIEQVAFVRVESRLAAALLARLEGDTVATTHQELATQIGTAREVVSRQLNGFVNQGLVTRERGLVRILDKTALRRLC